MLKGENPRLSALDIVMLVAGLLHCRKATVTGSVEKESADGRITLR